MDGPSINMRFYSELAIDVGSCGLHIIHGAFKTGVECIDWLIKNTLKESFQVLHDTPARRSDYISVTECFPTFLLWKIGRG